MCRLSFTFQNNTDTTWTMSTADTRRHAHYWLQHQNCTMFMICQIKLNESNTQYTLYRTALFDQQNHFWQAYASKLLTWITIVNHELPVRSQIILAKRWWIQTIWQHWKAILALSIRTAVHTSIYRIWYTCNDMLKRSYTCYLSTNMRPVYTERFNDHFWG